MKRALASTAIVLFAARPAAAAEPPAPTSAAPASAPVSMAIDPIDHSLDPPPDPPRWAAKGFLLGGGVLLVGGFAGTLLSPHCETRDARGGCVDPRGSAGVFPLMMAAGLVAGVVGAALWRQNVEPPP